MSLIYEPDCTQNLHLHHFESLRSGKKMRTEVLIFILSWLFKKPFQEVQHLDQIVASKGKCKNYLIVTEVKFDLLQKVTQFRRVKDQLRCIPMTGLCKLQTTTILK